jgi:hypothetical protein
MSPKVFRLTGTVLIVAGLIHWVYGFTFGTFWYANTALSYLESVRLWVSNYTQISIKPGILEEILGLCVAILGMSFRIAAQYGKEE